MEKEWIAIIGVAVGASLSGALSFLNSTLAYRREKRERRREEKIRLIEEVIAGSDAISNSLTYLYTNISVAALNGNSELKDLKIPDFPLSRIESITRLRFPALAGLFGEVIKARARCSEALMKFIAAYGGNPSMSRNEIRTLLDTVTEFATACNRLKEQAIKIGQSEIR